MQMQLTVIDVVCLIIILIFAGRAMLRGFVKEMFSLGAVVLGIAAAFFFYKNGAVFIREKLPDLANSQFIPEILSFIALFLIVFIVLKFIESLISDIMKRVNVGGIDSFLGFVFGVIEGVCFSALVFFIIHIQPLFEPVAVTAGSFFESVFKPFLSAIRI